jgi:hypothetical protein
MLRAAGALDPMEFSLHESTLWKHHKPIEPQSQGFISFIVPTKPVFESSPLANQRVTTMEMRFYPIFWMPNAKVGLSIG